jgi:nitrate/TMAO reductase-like tetraheme cytochrome c subunit
MKINLVRFLSERHPLQPHAGPCFRFASLKAAPVRGLALLLTAVPLTAQRAQSVGSERPADPGTAAARTLLAADKTESARAPEKSEARPVDAKAEHARLFTENKYPSAATCRTCHPDHYREWSVSAHAYAQLSPVFNAMAATITKLTDGSNGDFCIRCHTQVGMNLGEAIFMSNLDRHPTSREGITCVVCHRLPNAYGKVSGRFALVQGDIHEPVYGPTGNAELKRVLSLPDVYKVVTNRNESGRKIHTDVKRFFQISEPGFCGACHDVTLGNGFRLEEAFSSFKNSPAAHRGETCQDCHMGVVPGKKSGYAMAPAAIVGGVPTKPRKRTNHMFAGPDYSIVHPGFFPHNDKAAELATMREWLTFDYQAGWGTDEFENKVPKDFKFPPRWTSVDDRYDARAILNEQFKLLKEIHEQRVAILRVGYQLGDLVVKQADAKGLKFAIQVRNGTDGHNAPTGFDAERNVFMQVFVTDPEGKTVFKSGDLDPNGDVRDRHSSYVHHGDLPLDRYLFTLQSKFLTSNVRGGDREQVLAVNYSVDPLPFIRPEPFSTTFTGRPAGARVQRRGLEPFQSRWPEYRVDANELTGPGPYKVRIRFLAQMVPVNLITEIKVAGFDYNMSPRAVADALRDGKILVHEKEVTLPLDGKKTKINLAELPELAQQDAKY